MKMSYVLISLGILIMLIGSGFSALPMLEIKVDDVQISGITPVSASLIGVGAIIFLAGLGLYIRKK